VGIIKRDDVSILGKFMQKFLVKMVTLVMVTLIMSACGKRPQVVTGVQVQSSIQSQNIMLSLQADLDLGNMSFPAVTLPIIHPRGQTPIGSVDLIPVLGGKNQITIHLNVSELADIQAAEARLPNGNLIPLIANNPTVEVLLGAGAKLYLTATASAVAIGVAIPIKTFDGIGSNVGSVNLFPTFNIDKVVGAAGIFTSQNAGENGFALVADVSEYVKMQDIYVPQMALMQQQEASEEIKLDLSSHIPSRSQEDKINSMMLKINRKGKRLELNH
jgi:hypothetical protein